MEIIYLHSLEQTPRGFCIWCRIELKIVLWTLRRRSQVAWHPQLLICDTGTKETSGLLSTRFKLPTQPLNMAYTIIWLRTDYFWNFPNAFRIKIFWGTVPNATQLYRSWEININYLCSSISPPSVHALSEDWVFISLHEHFLLHDEWTLFQAFKLTLEKFLSHWGTQQTLTEQVKAKQTNDLVTFSYLLGLSLNHWDREKELQQNPLVTGSCWSCLYLGTPRWSKTMNNLSNVITKLWD